MGRKRRRVDSGNISRKHQRTAGPGLADGRSSSPSGSPSYNNNTNNAPVQQHKPINSMDEEREADFGKAQERGRRQERFAKVQHDDGGSRQSLRTKHSSKNLQESSDEEAHQTNQRLDQIDSDFDPKGKAVKDREKLRQSLDNMQQLEKAAEKLRCTDVHMDKWHQDLRLPNKVEYHLVEIGDTATSSTGDSDTKWQASTVTEKYLGKFGWDFSTGGDNTWNNPTPAEELYKNTIPLEGGNIPWDARPFVLVEGSNEIAERSDRLIKNGWKGAVTRLTSDNPSLFPQEWKAIQKAKGPRPELPQAYKDALNKGLPEVVSRREKKGMRRSASQRSNMADTQQKVTKDLSPEPLILPATLSMANQATNSVPSMAPTDHVGLRPFPASNLEPIHENRQTSPNPFISNQHTKASDEGGTGNVVDAFIAKWNLSPVYQHALLLAQLIEEDQLKFDRNESQRKLCKLLRSLEESQNPQQGPLPFKFIPMQEIEKLDREECRGNVALTENSPHIGDSAMEVARRWIEFSGMSGEEWNNPAGKAAGKADLDDILEMVSKKAKQKIKSPAELVIERKVGGLFAGLFKFDDLVEVTNRYLRSPRHLRQAGIRPYPDCAVRPSGECWNFWPAALTPTVASFDAKQSANVNNKQVAAQLALNILPTLIVSICMYLDTRKHATDPLPGWMFFYSWLYTEKGYIVYIHYPSAELTEDATDWSWRFHSLQLTTKFGRVWNSQTSNAYVRMGASSAMLQIRSHTRFALGQIRAWAKSRAQYGGGGILDQLIARSHYEEKNTEWLFDQVAKLTGNGKGVTQSD